MEDECYLLFTEEMPKDVNRKECQLTAIRSCGPEVKQSYSLPDYLQNHDLQRTHQKRKLDKALSHKNDSNYKAKPTKKGGQASSPKRGDSNVDASCAETVSEDEQLSRFALDWRQVFVVNNSISDEEPVETQMRLLKLGPCSRLGQCGLNSLLKSALDLPIMSSGIFPRTKIQRLAVKKYAFYIIDGPWAHLWCRFGYEPRFYPDAKAYQTVRIDFGDCLRLYKANNLEFGTQDTACAVPVTKSSSSSSDDSGNDQTDFLYIRGQQTRFSKIWFSICDIKLPIADAILEHDENPLTRRARADDRYGWLPPGALDAVKQVIQEDICSVVQLAGLPDVVTKKDYRYSTQRKNCLLTHAREAFDGIVSKCEDDKGVASNISNEDEHKGAHEGAELKLSGLKEESQRKGDAECMKEENCMKDSAGCLEGYNETLINLDDDECAQTGVGSAVENEGIGELGVLTSNMYNINDFVAFVMNRYSAGVGWCGGEEGTEADFDKYDLNGSYAVSAWNGYAERAEFDERYVTSLNGWFLDGSPLSVNALGANTSLTMEENVNGSGKAVEAQNFDDETEKEFNEILSSMNKILNSDSNS